MDAAGPGRGQQPSLVLGRAKNVGTSLGPIVGVVVGQIDGAVRDRELEVTTGGIELDEAVNLRRAKPDLDLCPVLADKARPVDAAGQLGPADGDRARASVEIVARVVNEPVAQRSGRSPDRVGIRITGRVAALAVERIDRGRSFGPCVALAPASFDYIIGGAPAQDHQSEGRRRKTNDK